MLLITLGVSSVLLFLLWVMKEVGCFSGIIIMILLCGLWGYFLYLWYTKQFFDVLLDVLA